ncbi:hypothetical protein NM208_g8361 [Fusarium decemcellulare]|uniref:Uncharacterized protein n=1 Tax=Fusarium decemcellulare TaxID=57161 RepID=A0ACC1S5L3_9HYPO|nr:hypothetical protein NM208_g8361 [Fusarium decemcellulare]
MTTTIGIAGITGKFSGLILKRLLDSSDAKIKGFCRNAAKLPDQVRSSARVTIIEGGAYDKDAVRNFVKGCDVIVCGYLGDDELMTEGQKLLVDACELEKIPRYIAGDFSLDFTKLEYGQLPSKDPMKVVKSYLETKPNVEGVHVLIGVFMETFWSDYIRLWNPEECCFDFYGTGDETWEATSYGTAAAYVAAVALDRDASGVLHFVGERKSLRQVAADFEQVYCKKLILARQGSLDELYSTMHAKFKEDPSNRWAWINLFYQYYCTNGQTYLKEELDNVKYPDVKPVTFKQFLQSYKIEELSTTYRGLGFEA